jgi:hypothetical protein
VTSNSSSSNTKTSHGGGIIRRTVNFSPYARCVKVESHRDMTADEKAAIWWTTSDYSSFARVGRIITKALLEGGSEIWLQPAPSSSSTTTQTVRPTGSTGSLSMQPSKTGPKLSAATDDKISTTLATPILKQSNASNVETAKKFHETRDKWWHRFGHSRRGLEHLASIGEGSQRHANVRSSIKAVIQEQQRCRILKSHANENDNNNTAAVRDVPDDEKIRTVYLRHTQWARSLSRAAGQSDADAVRSDFDEMKRKPREFYLKAQMMGDFDAAKGRYDDDDDTEATRYDEDDDVINGLSSFMRKFLTIEALKLDAHTASQLCFRYQNLKQQQKQRQTSSLSSSSSITPPKIVSTSSVTPSTTTVANGPNQTSKENEVEPTQSFTCINQKESPLPTPTPPATLADEQQEEKKSDNEEDVSTTCSSSSSFSSSPTSSSSSSTSSSVPSSLATLAKIAQGYSGSDEENRKTDMSAVLTGQGLTSQAIVG